MTSLSSARLVGMIVFFVGVALLLIVFFEARADLTRPLTGAPSAMGFQLGRQIALLFIMGYVGSSLAGRGAQLFQAGALRAIAEDSAVVRDNDPPQLSPPAA